MQMQETRQIKQIIGSNIALRRAELGWTRRTLAVKLDVDTNAIYKWEKGRHRPDDRYLAALSLALGRDLAWMVTDHQEPEASAA